MIAFNHAPLSLELRHHSDLTLKSANGSSYLCLNFVIKWTEFES